MLTAASIASIAVDIQLAIAAAKYATPVVLAAKDFITALFQSGAITIEQQSALHAHLDALMLAAINRQTPPSWTVVADPA